MILASTRDFRRAAQRRLPRFLFDYIDGGAYDERTMEKNVSDLTEIALRQRVLRDVSKIELSTTLFGREVSMPVVLGPIGISGMSARRGEVQAAQAACNAGVPFTLSTRKSRRIARRRSGINCM
jgi:L-lactate dehydrogenase (cytochrome)